CPVQFQHHPPSDVWAQPLVFRPALAGRCRNPPSLARIRRYRQVAARQSRKPFIPLKAAATKRLRRGRWILAGPCGYRATRSCRGAGLWTRRREIARNSDMTDDAAERETGNAFLPRFDSAGLLTAVAQDSANVEA